MRYLIALVVLWPATVWAADISGPAQVIDGDTIQIGRQRIRLHGIDAPESAQPCIIDVEIQFCGQQATLALDEKIARQFVTCEPRDTDRYGRIIAVCRVGAEDINAWMVENGWAMAYRQYSLDYVPLEDKARAARVGIWRGDVMPPWEFRAHRRERLRSKRPRAPAASVPTLRPDPRPSLQPAQRACCKVCRKGQPCGNSCISWNKTCHQPPGCAC